MAKRRTMVRIRPGSRAIDRAMDALREIPGATTPAPEVDPFGPEVGWYPSAPGSELYYLRGKDGQDYGFAFGGPPVPKSGGNADGN